MNSSFDFIIENPISLTGIPVRTLGQILFEPLRGRDENCKIILSHIENEFVEISLPRLRLIVLNLVREFWTKEIRGGQTIVLLTFQGCNEMFTALYFIALASIGCRVFMPMYSETSEFSDWVDLTQTSHIILPVGEVMSLDGHEREKSAIREIKNIASGRKINIWDNLSDFGLPELLKKPDNDLIDSLYKDSRHVISTDPDEEVLIVTTSGTSGRSRLVVYTHKAYFFNCLSWEQAGFYKPALLGGTGFTPLFTHTMGIRAFINALWTGFPVCLIITEWFLDKPEIVRFLLLKMKPAHITGGPAVYNAIIELFRSYPELKTGLSAHLKTLVSSGALYSPVTSNEILNATGLILHNAFGTTETQQVCSTLLSPPSVFMKGMIPLGKPLPGVSIGLIKTDTGINHFRLFLKSVFSHKCCLTEGKISGNDYYDTGDIVILEDNENLFYSGRASQDYFKDSFGVKIPISSLKNYYGDLLTEVLHAEFYPIINFPGIACLLFIQIPEVQPGLITESRILKRYAGIVEGINNRLMSSIETFEFQHRHICRIAILNQAPPLTGKGSVSGKGIALAFREVIERLTDNRKDASGIEITERFYQITDKYTRFISPQIGSMMSALKLNVTYHRGQKDSLFTYLHGVETEVLDLAGGYGTNLTGHNHPGISAVLTDFVSSGKVALCSQVSVQQAVGLLAEKLNVMVGASTGRSFQVILANSGSEAVEIALHHAFSEWKKRLEKFRDQQIQLYGNDKEADAANVWKNNMEIIEKSAIKVIGLSQAFHGHSTGARSILGNEKKRNRFKQLSKIEPLFIDDRDKHWQEKLDALIADSMITIRRITREDGCIDIVPYKTSSIIAAIAEPVIGEGGVRIVNREFLGVLSAQEFPLISDEIQCGLGRSGNIPEYGSAQYYLFGKALGGGLEKIAAVLIDSSRFCYNFSENYLSTFSNGELAAEVAIATLDIINGEKLCQRSLETGRYLNKKLSEIRKRYPSIISDIQGQGLMQAIYFDPGCASGSIMLRILFQTEKAGYLFSAWFLNRFQIRIFPTLSAPNVLRLEPSAYFNRSETDRFCQALNELCLVLQECRVYDLFSFMMDGDPFGETSETVSVPDHYNPILEPPAEGAVKVAFIAHFVFPIQELRMLDSDLGRASDTGLRIFFKRMQTLLELKPVQIIATNLFNNKVHFSFYIIPVDSAELEYLHKSGKRRYVVSKIQEAVDWAASKGARVISLGGYTSILTNNGLSLAEPKDSRIITGNTLTAASGLMHLGKVIRHSPEFNKPNTIAVIGSTGNIGKIITEMLYEQDDICSRLLLVSRSEKREADFINRVKNGKNLKLEIIISSNLYEIKNADVIVICTNTNDPIIFPYHISSDKPVLISDLSVPSAVSEEVKHLPNVRVLPFAAYVCLPEDKETVISSYSPRGTVFCCAGEAILLALDSCTEPLKGKILPDAVKSITKLADCHGFFQSSESMKSYKTGKV